MKPMLLGINIDHVATIRQARGTPYPDIVNAAIQAIEGGADSITVHLREDRRHIQDLDVYELAHAINVPLNLEMAMTDEMLAIAMDVKPAFCCIVPEKREELTTEGGLDVVSNQDTLTQVIQVLQTAGIRVSLFIDPELSQIEASHECGVSVIEIHTGRYAEAATDTLIAQELTAIQKAVEFADGLGVQVNAGHGLNIKNVTHVAAIHKIVELNIGHSIVAQSVFDGIKKSVSDLKACIMLARK